MSTKLFTFHKVIAACEEGSREGWEVFLADYTPMVFALHGLYLPTSSEGREEFWRRALIQLTANSFERLKKFEHQAEAEFLADLRDFLLDLGAHGLDPARDCPAGALTTPEAVGALLKGLPFVHQEVLFLKLAGYTDASLEKMLVITPAVAAKSLEGLDKDFGEALGRDSDRSVWPAAWAKVLGFARAAKQPNCPPRRQFVRIQEGGRSWYEKEPAEQHVNNCFHCLEGWTALREIKYWRREAKPLASSEVEGFVSSLPASGKARPSLLARMFG